MKEDILGRHLGNEAGDFDRGFHVLVGEQEFRGKHRVDTWGTSIAHWAFVQDYRTEAVVLEPRVDNERYVFFPSVFLLFLGGGLGGGVGSLGVRFGN